MKFHYVAEVDTLLSVVTVINTLQHGSTDKVSHISSSLHRLSVTVTYQINLVIYSLKLRGHVIINHSNIHRALVTTKDEIQQLIILSTNHPSENS
jgi:hypothetical protein